MKLYLSTWSLHNLFFQNLLDVSQMPALGKALGFDGVELEDIWFRPSATKDARKVLERSKASKSSTLIAISNDFTVTRKREFQQQVRHVIRFLRIACQLGSDPVRILMGARSSSKAAVPYVIEGFRRVSEEAKRLNLRLAVENHDPLSKDPDLLLSVLSEFDEKMFGVCLDLGNLDPRKRYVAIKKLASRAFMVHAKAYRFRKDAESAIDYRRCLEILRDANFHGPLVVEYDGRDDQLLGSMMTKKLVERWRGVL